MKWYTIEFAVALLLVAATQVASGAIEIPFADLDIDTSLLPDEILGMDPLELGEENFHGEAAKLHRLLLDGNSKEQMSLAKFLYERQSVHWLHPLLYRDPNPASVFVLQYVESLSRIESVPHLLNIVEQSSEGIDRSGPIISSGHHPYINKFYVQIRAIAALESIVGEDLIDERKLYGVNAGQGFIKFVTNSGYRPEMKALAAKVEGLVLKLRLELSDENAARSEREGVVVSQARTDSDAPQPEISDVPGGDSIAPSVVDTTGQKVRKWAYVFSGGVLALGLVLFWRSKT